MPTGGEVLVAALRALDVEVAFGLPGVHNLAAWKAFPGSGVRLVGVREAAGLTRKEALAAVAAETGLPKRDVYDAVVAAKAR